VELTKDGLQDERDRVVEEAEAVILECSLAEGAYGLLESYTLNGFPTPADTGNT
jgi:hypothetical protein